MPSKRVLGIAVFFVTAAAMALAQTMPATAPATRAARPPTGPQGPATLPGTGLAQHDFFYSGESNARKAFIVKGGKVVWSYDDPAGKGEVSDAVLLSNGSVLLAHQFAVKLIAPDKKVLWNFDAPAGTEIHTALPIGKEHVLYIQNGKEPVLKVVNITTNETKLQFPLTVKNPAVVHPQFRHARLTKEGTILIAHMDAAKISEYDTTGKELWTIPTASTAWGVEQLKNGNILYVDARGAHEIDRKNDNKVVWEYTRADVTAAGYRISNWQEARRLANGNTIINNWATPTGRDLAANNPVILPVQVIEVTPDKQIVWALREWTEPNLGPSTTVLILDASEGGDAAEDVHFGDIK